MLSITVNCHGDHAEPTVKVLLNENVGYFAVLDLGQASVILPGQNRAAAAYLYQLADVLNRAAAELEGALVPAVQAS